MVEQPVKRTLSVDEAAHLLGVSRRTIYRRIRSQELAAVRLWPHAPWRIPREAIAGVQEEEMMAGRRCADCLYVKGERE